MAGATAEVVTDPAELGHVVGLMLAKFPQLQHMAVAAPDSPAVLKIKPRVISVLDYTKGFGHTELVEVENASE